MAKPDNWDSLSKREQIEIAQRLIGSTRGHLIMGQALARALKAMTDDRYPEGSNMEDMEILGVLFEPWFEHYRNPPVFDQEAFDRRQQNGRR